MTGWRAGATIQAGIPAYSPKAIEATIAYCRYVYERYGRFPVSGGPFGTVLAFQAHRLDPDFYARFYREEAVGHTADHMGNRAWKFPPREHHLGTEPLYFSDPLASRGEG